MYNYKLFITNQGCKFNIEDVTEINPVVLGGNYKIICKDSQEYELTPDEKYKLMMRLARLQMEINRGCKF